MRQQQFYAAVCVLFLCGCDQRQPQPPVKWVVVPVTNSFTGNESNQHAYAWKLNTQTGDLYICTFEEQLLSRDLSCMQQRVDEGPQPLPPMIPRPLQR